mgnify:CR=1 FL=1
MRNSPQKVMHEDLMERVVRVLFRCCDPVHGSGRRLFQTSPAAKKIKARKISHAGSFMVTTTPAFIPAADEMAEVLQGILRRGAESRPAHSPFHKDNSGQTRP